MPWKIKIAECNYCGNEINGISETVFESVKGTLCETCEKARVAEEKMYENEDNDARLRIVLEKEKERLVNNEGDIEQL